MPTILFEFLEVVAEELATDPSRVITREDLRINDEESPLLDELKRQTKAASSDEAIHKAVLALREHFVTKTAELPFTFDAATGRFTATDTDFLAFIKDMSSVRGLGKRSRTFECSVANRLGKRTTGSIYRVGHPRDVKRKKAAFNAHLRCLGFDSPVCLGKEKDGGLDILWLLPIGSIPHRPMVSLQCKNGEFNIAAADTSLGAASRSLGQHGGLQERVHVPCVLFNDYIWPELLVRKRLNFVPLGLTDLASISPPTFVELL